MKKLFFTLLLFVGMASTAQVPSEITNLLNTVCSPDFPCATLTLGCCVGDEVENPDQCVPQIYFVTQDVVLNSDGLILKQVRLEFRNGANFVNNGFTIETLCNSEIVFIGGGAEFNSVEDMNATLSLQELIKQNELPPNKKYKIYNFSGQLLFEGVTNKNTLRRINRKYPLILEVEGIRPIKLPLIVQE